jgi:hypothetical protein
MELTHSSIIPNVDARLYTRLPSSLLKFCVCSPNSAVHDINLCRPNRLVAKVLGESGHSPERPCLHFLHMDIKSPGFRPWYHLLDLPLRYRIVLEQ